MSDQLLKMAEHVVGILDKVESALDKVNAMWIKVERISDKVDGIADHLDTLTELVQSTPALPITANGNGSGVPNAPSVPSGMAWTCSTELRVRLRSASVSLPFLMMVSIWIRVRSSAPLTGSSSKRVWSLTRLWRPLTANGWHTRTSIVSRYLLFSIPILPSTKTHFLFKQTAVRQSGAVAQFLPPQVNGVSDVTATRTYNSEIKNVAKHVRERLHLLVSGIICALFTSHTV